jgi:hypothetical protein
LAENEHELQTLLDALHTFCVVNKLKVNATKTKIMVLTRSKIRLRNLPAFMYGEDELERVEDYTYLGLNFSWNGKFDKCKNMLASKANIAMFSIIQKGRKLNLPLDVMLILFDKCVMPILLYNVEVLSMGF